MAAAGPLALITGVGPGTGAATARRFAAGGYRVAMLARGADRLRRLEEEIPEARGYACDVADETAIDVAVNSIRRDMGDPDILIHNAVGGVSGSEVLEGVLGTFLDIDPAALEYNFRVNTMALLHFARRVAPAMVSAGRGAILGSVDLSPR